jgi:bifunctional non-homologous end joining protein LigD
VRDGRARLLSRNGNDLTARFHGAADALRQLPDGTVIDGELVVLDSGGYPNFAALMRGQGAPCLLAFDLLMLDDRDLCAEPIENRKRRLTDMLSALAGPGVQNTDWMVGEGRALFELVKARGMECIVAKRLGSRYAPGRRSGSWVKIKVPGYAPERWADWFDRGRQQRHSEPADV